MRRVWRVTTSRFAGTAFSGEGARLYGGRWNPKGNPVVYTAQSQSLALLEMLVQDEPLRARYVLIPADLPEGLSTRHVSATELPAEWRTVQARDVLQDIGRHWLARGTHCVLAVPSAVVPAEWNYLLNPTHPEFEQVVIGETQPLDTDLRLLRNLAR